MTRERTLAELAADPAVARAGIAAAVRISSAWKLTSTDTSALLGIPEHTWHAWQRTAPQTINAEQAQRLSLLIGIQRALHALYGSNLANAWVRIPNHGNLFSGETPLQAMTRGGIQTMTAVRRLLDGRVQGNP